MKKILVADDMPTVFEQIREIIGDRYEVITAGTGAEVQVEWQRAGSWTGSC